MDPPCLEDFEAIKVVGKGSYGKVMLVRKGGEVYAMKMLRKEHVLKRNQVEHTKTERNVLEAVSHPFIVTMHYAFQTPKKLYFVLEFCPGGELFYHLSRAGRFSEGRCRFYASEILEAIDYLHRLNIIYRDLKPENILLDGQGHVKLTDFGLSKEGIDDNYSAMSMCGTPEYLAPEILDKRGHGKAVDWYSHGALMFEMLTGLPPHYTRDRQKLFERIRSARLNYPAYVSPVAKDLLEQLLARDPKNRLGGGPGDGDEVKVHAWFAAIDWRAINLKLVTPPFKPNLRSDGDIKYVDEEFLKMGVGNSEAAASTADDSHFEGFTYVAA
jgi:protein-serine/threonine kinase